MNICIVGLGYVGLPLAISFSKENFNVIGFDVNEKRINELKSNLDSNRDVKDFQNMNINFTSNQEEIKKADFIIIAVPTPITNSKKPDLKYLESASKIVGQNLSKDAIIVYESTVYPGVTEEICKPILEKYSNLKCGKDFKIGYSPERINPGDKTHTIEKIKKIVSGIDKESTEIIARTYEKIIKVGIYKAPNIKTAEAAKVIENIQRDLNIALMNELSLIFKKLNIDTKDVLEAARTKWNFHNYHPGLVGGHCIGIDPYYLTYKAEQIGYHPQVILAGRRINDYMPEHVAELVVRGLNQIGKVTKNSKILILGLTFKENVKDTRNSKILKTIEKLKEYGANTYGYDPLIDESEFNIQSTDLDREKDFDCIILATPHDDFKEITLEKLKSISKDQPLLIDIRNFFDKKQAINQGFIYHSL